ALPYRKSIGRSLDQLNANDACDFMDSCCGRLYLPLGRKCYKKSNCFRYSDGTSCGLIFSLASPYLYQARGGARNKPWIWYVGSNRRSYIATGSALTELLDQCDGRLVQYLSAEGRSGISKEVRVSIPGCGRCPRNSGGHRGDFARKRISRVR